MQRKIFTRKDKTELEGAVVNGISGLGKMIGTFGKFTIKGFGRIIKKR